MQADPATIGIGATIAIIVTTGALKLAGKLVDKWQPIEADQRTAVDPRVTALAQTVEHQSSEIDLLRKDVKDLRQELRASSLERHLLYTAITECTTQHPITAEWWAERMRMIADRISIVG